MRESIGIDSVLGGWAMPKAYSEDMRARVIAEVESGASRRAVAEEFDVSASTAIIWVKCFRETGRCTAKPRGGSVSPLEKHADFLLGLIARTWLRSLNHQQCTALAYHCDEARPQR